MALILGVKIGDVVDIAEHWLAVLSVDSWDSATLIGNGGNKTIVTANDMVAVTPDVWIGLAPRTPKSKLRLVFNAPRHITITRRHEQERKS
jgi:hypothetical protein